MMESYKISLVIPVYNEEEVLPISFARMQSAVEKMGCAYELIYVDDGSGDDTYRILENICAKDPNVKVLGFSRNFGHQLAVTAGMDAADGDCVVIIDADLQDPPELIPRMVDMWKQGYQIVYGQRKKREGESVLKKLSAFLYYRVLRALTPIQIPLDTGDFRLLDRKVNATLKSMREHNRFLRGMSAWAGFKSAPLEYVRDERVAGKTKYTLKKMLKLAADGIVGYSATPLTLPFVLGGGVCALSVLGMLAALVSAVAGVHVVPWLWAFLGLLLVQGVMLTVMGVQGAYLSRVYDEVQGRPLYIVGRHSGAVCADEKLRREE